MERNNGASHRPSSRDFGPIAGGYDANGSSSNRHYRTAEFDEPEAGLDYIFQTDKSAASVEEVHRKYFRSAVRANSEVGDRHPDYYLPSQGGRSQHRYWVVDRDKIEYGLKIAGHVIFWGSIGAIATAILVGLIFG